MDSGLEDIPQFTMEEVLQMFEIDSATLCTIPIGHNVYRERKVDILAIRIFINLPSPKKGNTNHWIRYNGQEGFASLVPSF